jgi:hypothetical protein
MLAIPHHVHHHRAVSSCACACSCSYSDKLFVGWIATLPLDTDIPPPAQQATALIKPSINHQSPCPVMLCHVTPRVLLCTTSRGGFQGISRLANLDFYLCCAGRSRSQSSITAPGVSLSQDNVLGKRYSSLLESSIRDERVV